MVCNLSSNQENFLSQNDLIIVKGPPLQKASYFALSPWALESFVEFLSIAFRITFLSKIFCIKTTVKFSNWVQIGCIYIPNYLLIKTVHYPLCLHSDYLLLQHKYQKFQLGAEVSEESTKYMYFELWFRSWQESPADLYMSVKTCIKHIKMQTSTIPSCEYLPRSKIFILFYSIIPCILSDRFMINAPFRLPASWTLVASFQIVGGRRLRFSALFAVAPLGTLLVLFIKSWGKKKALRHKSRRWCSIVLINPPRTT